MERREYFRTKSFLPFSFRVISEEEFERLKRVIKYGIDKEVKDLEEINLLREKITQKIEEGDLLFYFLSLIDKKIQILMDYILEEKIKKDSNMEYREIEISASGAKFYPDVPIEVGDLLELKIILPLFGFEKIHILSQVTRVGEEEIEDGRRRYAASKFLEMKEYQRDLLMRYIFKVERERIRLNKDTL